MKEETFSVLKFRNVRVQYDGIIALDLAELDLFKGSRFDILLGPNGAGKSSLINAVTGYAKVRSPGKIIFENGVRFELSTLSRDSIVCAGISRTFQIPALFHSLTVEESLFLAAVLGKRTMFARKLLSLLRSPRGDKKATQLVKLLIREFALESVAQARMDELPFAVLRRAELARALATQPRILFLDEPSAGADEAEKDFLIDFLASKLPEMIRLFSAQGLYRNADLAIGLVTHDRALLTGLLRACLDQPVTHCFERGHLKSSCRLGEWMKNTEAP